MDNTNDNSDIGTKIESIEIEFTKKELESEKWRNICYRRGNIKFYTGYLISSLGRVMKIDSGKILKLNVKSGYLACCISSHDFLKGYKSVKVHRLVGKYFVTNDDPEKKIFINHINGNKFYNRVENLEWATPSQNIQHAHDIGAIKRTVRAVKEFDSDGKLIKEYGSISEAASETGVSTGNISDICNGKFTVDKNDHTWKYSDVNPNANVAPDLTGFKRHPEFTNYFIGPSGQVYSEKFKKFLKAWTKDGHLEVQLSRPEIKGGEKKRITTPSGKRRTIKTRDSGQIKKTYQLHRLVAEVFFDLPDDYFDNPNKYHVIHINGDKSNNSIDNLQIATQSQSHSHLSKKLKKKATKSNSKKNITDDENNYNSNLNSDSETDSKNNIPIDENDSDREEREEREKFLKYKQNRKMKDQARLAKLQLNA